MNTITLGFADERDKTYGIAGMVITLVAMDGEDNLEALDLDGPAGEWVLMSNSFGSKGNPRMSAKIIWEQTLAELRMETSMALGNIACRRYVLSHTGIGADEIAALRKALIEDAKEHCGLENDESERLFESCHSYVDRIFLHSGIQDVAHRFAANIAERRRLTASEAVEMLASMGLR